MHIGLKIRELAVKKNITLADLAKTLGKTKQAIYDMVEKEDVNSIILKQLSSIYGVPVSYFFGEDKESMASIQEKLDLAQVEIEKLRAEIVKLKSGRRASTKVLVELDIDDDEFIKMGLKDKVIQIVNK